MPLGWIGLNINKIELQPVKLELDNNQIHRKTLDTKWGSVDAKITFLVLWVYSLFIINKLTIYLVILY